MVLSPSPESALLGEDDRLRSAVAAGPRLYLRQASLDDVTAEYHRWLNDPEVNRFLEVRFFPQSMEQIRSFVAAKQGSSSEILFAVILGEGHRHIGNLKLGPIDWIHRRGDLSFFIGAKDLWGQGLMPEAIGLACEYGFERLNLHRLTASVYSNNTGSLRAAAKVGFEQEGVRREHFFSDGRYVDAVLLGLLRSDWRKRK